MPLYQTPPACPIDHLALVGQDDAPALMLRGGTLSYQDLRYRVAALAGWLAGQMAPGARVASWVAKGEIACLMPLAAARAGLVHVPINPLLKRAQVAHILADSGAEVLIATPARGATLEFADLADARLVVEDVALAEAQSADPLPPQALIRRPSPRFCTPAVPPGGPKG